MPDEEIKEPTEPTEEDRNSARELDAAMARFEGNFIESCDLMQSRATLTIVSVIPPNTEKDNDGKGKLIDKPILGFRGTPKRLICNSTNERIIKAIHGKKASGWLGKQITLMTRYLKEVKMLKQKNVPTVRVVPPKDIPLPLSCREFFGADVPYPEEN